ncbi:MAG: glutathione S-transferase N-terminal domain-containing protein [bacterium]
MSQLISLSYSPWSERARWALDHHHIQRRNVEYVPMVGEPYLRWKLGKLTGRVTVPVFVDEAGVWKDSLDIARRADAIGSGSPLFPAGTEDEIARWNERAERILAASRVLSLRRTAANPRAIQESMPFPKALKPYLLPLGRSAVAFIAKKYATAALTDAAADAAIHDGLSEIRAALAGKRGHLLGDGLTYADIVAATSFQLAAPVADRYIRLGPETRKCCTSERVSRDFADLVAWRDELYAKYR